MVRLFPEPKDKLLEIVASDMKSSPETEVIKESIFIMISFGKFIFK
jgi:hypothetical protein